jgi:hypothetical protein
MLVALVTGMSSCATLRFSKNGQGHTEVSERTVRAQLEMLASDALQGRNSMSRDSWVAATYIASELRRIGVEPAGDAGGYLQRFVSPDRQPAAAAASPPDREGWNVIGRISGREADAHPRALLLSAHLDHIGASGTGADRINNGADDDASGVSVVLALAEALARGDRPRRTIYVLFFDGEERGGLGAAHLLDHSPVPLADIAALIGFEMLGRPDPIVARGAVWLTGYDRSTLGPELARSGAKIVADPRPTSRFFERSDNIEFAYRGIVAHTISSFGLHSDYHRPGDEIGKIDFPHLVGAIRMLLPPVRRLANTQFEPAWVAGGRPERPVGRRP